MKTKTIPTNWATTLALFTVVSAATAQFQEARWIAPPSSTATNAALPLFRKEFVVTARPEHATIRIIGLGDYDISLNGRRLAETGINQPWSQYEKTIYYRDFDITMSLVRGTNCVGVMLNNSFWHNPNPPAGRYNKKGPQRKAEDPLLLCAEIMLQPKGGSTEHIGSDTTWRTAEGPVAFSHIFAGEDFDARRRQAGWDRAGFNDREWQAARLATAPAGKLERQFFPGIGKFGRHAPVSVKEPSPGVLLYSFPKNVAAQLRVELEGGQSGDRVQFRCGEHKNDKDRLFGGYVVGCDVVTDGQPLTHQWVSFYLGMQFVEVTGAVPKGRSNPQNLPVVRRMELVPVRAALPQVGTFHSSSDLYNRTHELIDAAVRANMNWVMTDCPHREKLGWLECSYLLAPTFLYRYEGRDWYSKIAHDIRDAQEPSGRVLTVAPSYPAGRFPGADNWTVEWGAAAVMVPWHHYEWFGDLQILRDNFDMMRRFTDYIQTEAKDGLAPGGLGDWYDYGHGQRPGPSRFTPTELSATATWGLCALTVSRAAEALGQTEDAKKYRELHTRITADFQRHFQDPVTRKLRHNGSPQCANSMALCADLVPQADRAVLVQDIIADLEKRGWQQTPGDVGHVYFLRALAEAGRSDILHRVYSRDGTGSYGGILSKGLTSLPETWDAMMDGRQSLNHCMLGHVMEWFYGYIGGIRQQPGSVGWQKILIAPNPGALANAEATLQTPRGRVVSRWRKDGATFRLETEIPKGVNAMAILPSGETKPLRSGRQTLKETARPPG
ncbi:MAG: alpha-L-rhamnosidase N-terminal domain-containing protein [Verrucomicrobia bacterium]|nr:alpha-L-rhamnosidase N-terminal domain-containing protein [Verrucomicrobiota bacterium]